MTGRICERKTYTIVILKSNPTALTVLVWDGKLFALNVGVPLSAAVYVAVVRTRVNHTFNWAVPSSHTSLAEWETRPTRKHRHSGCDPNPTTHEN